MTNADGTRAILNVLIVEDNPAMEAEAMEAVKIFADANIRTARTIAEAERWMKRVRFDLAIVDLGLPDGSGISLIKALSGGTPAAPDVPNEHTICLARTVFDDDDHLFAALSAGTQGYLLKGESIETFRMRLISAVNGEPVVSPAIARRVLAYFRGDTIPVRARQKTPPSVPPAALTQRETEVLKLLALGHTLGEAGKVLSLSVNTVKTHVKNVYARLDVTTRLAAVDTARRMGLLDDSARRYVD
jgi:DNA-binding NarL/FixJ family response regulator